MANFFTLRPNTFYFLALLILSSSCATGGRKVRHKLRESFKLQNLKAAHKIVESSKDYRDESNKLLFLLEKGMLHHVEKKYFQSIHFLNKAKVLADKLYTKSFKGKAKSIVFNDNYDKYYGDVYERSMIYFYLSLNHFLLAQKGEIESRTVANKIIPSKTLTKNEKINELSKARSEILAWDSFLASVRKERRGKSVFKYDLMAKIYGGLVHEAIGTHGDKQIALQLYKDGAKILFRNYNAYETFNEKFIKFKGDYAKLPRMKKKKIIKNYTSQTTYYRELKDLFDYKILSLTRKIRSYDMQKMIKKLRPSKAVLKRIKREKRANISIVFQEGLIPIKSASTQYFGLKKAMTSKKGGARVLGAIGHIALTVFAAEKLGLTSAPRGYHPAGAAVGIHTASVAAQELAIEFELPEIKKKKNVLKYVLRIFNHQNELLKETPLALVNPLGDIATEAVGETSAWRYSRLGARLALKHLIAIVASYGTYKATEKKLGKIFAKTAALVQYIGASKLIAASEKADTRYWSTLPQNLQMAEFHLPKGRYILKVIGLKKSGDTFIETKEMRLQDLTVKSDSRHELINYRSF